MTTPAPSRRKPLLVVLLPEKASRTGGRRERGRRDEGLPWPAAARRTSEQTSSLGWVSPSPDAGRMKRDGGGMDLEL
jgi:hypothetical protein